MSLVCVGNANVNSLPQHWTGWSGGIQTKSLSFCHEHLHWDYKRRELDTHTSRQWPLHSWLATSPVCITIHQLATTKHANINSHFYRRHIVCNVRSSPARRRLQFVRKYRRTVRHFSPASCAACEASMTELHTEWTWHDETSAGLV
jgi:hypothetical protein